MKFPTALLLICVVAFGASVLGEHSEASPAVVAKITIDELISKHVEAIGPARARARAGARLVAGTTHVTFRSRGVAQADGGAVLASDGPRSMVTMKFESSQYPYEKIGFDGSKVTAYQLPRANTHAWGVLSGALPRRSRKDCWVAPCLPPGLFWAFPTGSSDWRLAGPKK